MDLIETRAMKLSEMALNALNERHNLISVNIANADTPGYQRSDLTFEDQLSQIIKQDDANKQMKLMDMGLQYTPNSLSMDQTVNSAGQDINVNENPFDKFNPRVFTDDSPAEKADGNNVNIEKEMAELSKNGTKFTVIAELQSRAYKKFEEIIQMGGS